MTMPEAAAPNPQRANSRHGDAGLGRFALIRNAPSDGDAAQKDGLQACVSVRRRIRDGAGENRGKPRDG